MAGKVDPNDDDDDDDDYGGQALMLSGFARFPMGTIMKWGLSSRPLMGAK